VAQRARRIVAAPSSGPAGGRLIDGTPGVSITLGNSGDYRITEVWRAAFGDDWRHDPADAAEDFVPDPPGGGLAWRIFERPPDRDLGLSDSLQADQQEPGSWHGRGPGWQRGHDLTLVAVLRGEIWLLLDTSEILLTRGDCLVQRANMHRLSNRSSETCVMSTIVISHT
jgi:hypothetical protein